VCKLRTKAPAKGGGVHRDVDDCFPITFALSVNKRRRLLLVSTTPLRSTAAERQVNIWAYSAQTGKTGEFFWAAFLKRFFWRPTGWPDCANFAQFAIVYFEHFKKGAKIFVLLFSQVCIDSEIVLANNGSGYILGDFFTISSGHPARLENDWKKYSLQIISSFLSSRGTTFCCNAWRKENNCV
jgi:hypothetical protein